MRKTDGISKRRSCRQTGRQRPAVALENQCLAGAPGARFNPGAEAAGASCKRFITKEDP